MNQLQKNRLDLAYNRQLQYLNFILLLGFGSIISLFIGLILSPERWFNYALAFVIIGIITLIIHNNIDQNLRKISAEIRKL